MIAGPLFGLGNSPANKTTPIRPRQSEPQNPGFTLPNFKNSPTIPGFGSLGEVKTTIENGNSNLRPDAPPFKPGRAGERNHVGQFEPPAPQRLIQPNSFKTEKGPVDGPQGDQFTPGRPRGDFEARGPRRESWDEPRGPSGDFKPPNWREQGPNDFGQHGRDFRPDDAGPNFRGPPGDRFHGPIPDRQGLLGSPPRPLDMDSRPGLLGAPPAQKPPQLMQGPPGSQGGPTGPGENDFHHQGKPTLEGNLKEILSFLIGILECVV